VHCDSVAGVPFMAGTIPPAPPIGSLGIPEPPEASSLTPEQREEQRRRIEQNKNKPVIQRPPAPDIQDIIKNRALILERKENKRIADLALEQARVVARQEEEKARQGSGIKRIRKLRKIK